VKDPNALSDKQFIEQYYSQSEVLIEKVKVPHRSTNFLVHAPTPTMARAIAAEAEYQRAELAKLWLGKELPAWEKQCEIKYAPTASGVGTGVNVVSYGKAKDGSPALVFSRIELNGDFLNVLTDAVPSQVMQVVLHSHFGTVSPRWADEGLATMAKTAEAQAHQDDVCRQILNGGRGIRLSKLLPMISYPKDRDAYCSEGHSIVRFLIAQKVSIGPPVFKDIPSISKLFKNIANGQQQFIVFLHLGMEKNTLESWNNAAKIVYGYANVDALEDAWLDFLKKPENTIRPGVKLPDTLPKQENPDVIPPTALPVSGRPPELQGTGR
jgi:hypothetical protein